MEHKTVIRPYLPAMTFFVETWLSDMSEKGFRLARKSGWKFEFQIEKPKSREYFMYSYLGTSRKSLRAYAILSSFSDYLFAREHYENKNSPLSKHKNSNVFEVNEAKKDKEFERVHMSLDRYYVQHYLLFFIVFSICMMATGILCVFAKELLFLSLCCLGFTIYNGVSLIIAWIGRRKRKRIYTKKSS